ncbi:MAG: internal scaffolding protein [Microviridae sp.]|nr:MAG: internal scaffolding protein [Microviridae sp.]
MIDQETGEIQTPFIRTAYNYDVEHVSRETALHCLDETLTDQSQKKAADINEIVRQFGVTGLLPQQPLPEHFGDFTMATDYRTAIEAVRNAEAQFMELPAALRARFQNDPAELINFVADEKNRAEAQEIGLIPQDLETAPTLETPTPTDPTTS